MNDSTGDQVPPVDGRESLGAAQTRVTGDELARALALIEARKDAEAQRSADSISLGQAVDELGLEVTPEEILAEIQALRRKPRPLSADLPAGSPIQQDGTLSPLLPAQPIGDQAALLTHCPACSRKLLTQASALCNWCGAKINDPEYQELAARSRQQLDQSELSQLETMVQEETRYGIFGRLKRRAKDVGSKKPLG